MNHEHGHSGQQGDAPSRGKWVLLAFILIAGYFLIAEHRAHLSAYLPFVLLLACPLLHMFHGGHGKHGGQRDHGRSVSDK